MRHPHKLHQVKVVRVVQLLDKVEKSTLLKVRSNSVLPEKLYRERNVRLLPIENKHGHGVQGYLAHTPPPPVEP